MRHLKEEETPSVPNEASQGISRKRRPPQQNNGCLPDQFLFLQALHLEVNQK